MNVQGLSINVFVSHFHAEYDRGDDIYAGHRVMQALEAAQWIKLTSAGADLSIYAGDFNTELELSELEAFILEHEDTLGSAEASANQMVEQTR